MKKVLLFALLLSLTACAYVDPSLTEQTKVYTDAPVRKSTLQVSVHPKNKQYRPLTAYFHPFYIQQPSDDFEQLSCSFAQIFQNVWLEERLFPTMAYQPSRRYEGLEKALYIARSQGADVLVIGMVPYFYAGGTVDQTAITIQINIYSVKNGHLIWTMMQSGRMEDHLPDDYFYFVHETRLSHGAFNEIIRSIAHDMAIPIKGWLPDPEAQYQFASTAAGVQQNLTAQVPPSSNPNAQAPAKHGEADLPAEGTRKTGQTATAQPAPSKQAADNERPIVHGVNLNIEFDTDKSIIRPASYPLLDATGEALNTPELKNKRIIIAGHTDSVGDAKYNIALSQQRAGAVKEYLVNKWGIQPNSIEAVGYGNTRPIANGNTPADLQKNRRVEIRLAE